MTTTYRHGVRRPRWLSGLDASFLHLETSTQPLQVLSVLELDTSTIPGGYDYDRFRRDLAVRLRGMPAFRERPSHGFPYVGRPVWLEDDELDLDRHVRRIGLPAPAGRAEFTELCGYLASLPINHGGPLWEMWVIEGGHRLAVMIKFHHAEADGVTFATLLSRLCSAEPDAPPREPLPARGPPTGRTADRLPARSSPTPGTSSSRQPAGHSPW